MKEKENTFEEIQEMIKEYTLKQLSEEDFCFEKCGVIAIKFANYEVEEDYLIGIGDIEKFDIEKNKYYYEEERLNLIIALYALGETIYKNTNNIMKYYIVPDFENDRIINKARFEVNVNEILQNEKIYSKIIKFFKKYGMSRVDAIRSDNKNYKIDLKIFIRRVLDFYYTYKLWDELVKNVDISNKTFEEFSIILEEIYRLKNKEKLYIGITNNIQEKGLLGDEKKKHQIFDIVYYGKKSKCVKIKQLTSDYITLAYHQLGIIISNKPQGLPFRKCARLGCEEYIDTTRKNRIYCHTPECDCVLNAEKAQRSRRKNKDNKAE